MKKAHINILFENCNIESLCTLDTIESEEKQLTYLHEHDTAEIHVYLEGKGRILTESGKREIEAGTCLVIGAKTPHAFEVSSGNRIRRLEIMLETKKKAWPESLAQLCKIQNVGYWKLEEPVMSIVQLAVDELSKGCWGYEGVIASGIVILFTGLIRRMDDIYFKTFPVRGGVKEETDRERVANFFVLNYSKDVTIDDLADELNVSNRQAFRLVKKYMGRTFRQNLIFIRMNVAKRLLLETNLPVQEIAGRLGYEYSSSFCKAFRQETNMSPEVWRRKEGFSELF